MLKEDVANAVYSEWFKCHGSSMHHEDCAALADAAMGVVEKWALDRTAWPHVCGHPCPGCGLVAGCKALAGAIAAERGDK